MVEPRSKKKVPTVVETMVKQKNEKEGKEMKLPKSNKRKINVTNDVDSSSNALTRDNLCNVASLSLNDEVMEYREKMENQLKSVGNLHISKIPLYQCVPRSLSDITQHKKYIEDVKIIVNSTI